MGIYLVDRDKDISRRSVMGSQKTSLFKITEPDFLFALCETL